MSSARGRPSTAGKFARLACGGNLEARGSATGTNAPYQNLPAGVVAASFLFDTIIAPGAMQYIRLCAISAVAARRSISRRIKRDGRGHAEDETCGRSGRKNDATRAILRAFAPVLLWCSNLLHMLYCPPMSDISYHVASVKVRRSDDHRRRRP